MENNLTHRFLEILNYPILNRCPELGLLIDRCSTKQLQDIFPTLIQSIFGVNGSPGWGFRTITRNLNPLEFEVLYNFFIPLGPIFRLCYRLLNDALKFELPISYIPQTFRHMLESGRYPLFYSDIINIDPFQRKIISLSLNAFDYYMLNFTIHGTVPLHKQYPIALSIHNEKWKSVYFFLTADYLCSFLPSNPDFVVMPQNICMVKATPMMLPVQPVQSPVRSPKYLSLSAISHYFPSTATNNNNSNNNVNSTTNNGNQELSRLHAWRSESVLYLFIDTWFRFDRDESGDLPGNEFMSCARILVKQIHAFGNSTDIDNTSMATLRKIAQPMMNVRMFPFLKTIISRWPYDTSFSVVLELWLSFIQPWRYTFDRQLSFNMEIPITQKFETFISENLITYTQIYLQLLPRFQNIDLTTMRNALMLYRLLKVFGQSRLSEIIRNYEFSSLSTTNTSFGNSSKTERIHHSQHHQSLSPSSSNFNKTNHDMTTNIRSDSCYFQDDTSYIMMFGQDGIELITNLINKIQISKLMAQEQNMIYEREEAERYQGIIKWIKSFFVNDIAQIQGNNLAERRKIPGILDMGIGTLSRMFSIQINEEPISNVGHQSDLQNMSDQSNDGYHHSHDFDKSNSSQLSPSFMKKRALNLQYWGDPNLIPIKSSECTFLVRFLHQLSCKLNLMFSNEIERFWNRHDIIGKMTRHILSPPMIVQSFDKSFGYSKLKEEHLAPRISLRYLAAYKTFIVILLSFIIGQFLFGAPSYGLILLILLTIFYLFVLSLVHDVPI